MGWRRLGLLLIFAAAALLLALGASASPDPPHVDGGSVEFVANWTVDPFDDLLYVNQTIVLLGNLTVEQDGDLTLENCTLLMNCTSDGEFGIEVKGGGSLIINRSSEVGAGPSSHRFSWTVQAGGHVEVVGSAVAGAGWNSTEPGLLLLSGSNKIENSTFTDCWCAITAKSGHDTVSDLVVSRCVVGLHWSGSDATLLDISIDNCTYAAVWLDGSRRVIVLNLTATDCGEGLLAGPTCETITIIGCTVTSCGVGVNSSCQDLKLDNLDAYDCDPALLLSGQRATARNVTVGVAGPPSPMPGAGVIVMGSASDVVLDGLRISGCRDAVLIIGQVQHVTVLHLNASSVADGAIALTGASSGPTISDVTLDGLDLSLTGALYGIYAKYVDRLTIAHVAVYGQPAIALMLEGCSHASVSNLTARALQRVVSADGAGTATDLTIMDCWLGEGQYGAWLKDVSGVLLSNLTIVGSSIDCVLATGVEGLHIDRCTIKDGSRTAVEAFFCPNATVEASVLSGTPYLIHFSDSSNTTVRQAFLMDADVGLSLLRCDRATLSNVAANDTTVGFRLNATSASDAYRCDVDSAVDAFLLEGGTAGCALRNCSVSLSTTGVRMTGGARGNVVSDLALASCSAGLMADGAGDGNILRNTSMSDLDIGVDATSGTAILVEEGSFTDCAVAMRTGPGSWLNWTVAGTSTLLNCSVNISGQFTVDGSLMVSGANITFVSSSGDVGIEAASGSTLRLINGTSVNAFVPKASLSGYAINASGTLEVSRCTFDGGSSYWVPIVDAKGAGATVSQSVIRRGARLTLSGSYALVSNCTFWGDGQWAIPNLVLDLPLQPTITGCVFHSWSYASVHFLGDMMGEYRGTLVVRSTRFECMGSGGGVGMAVRSPAGSNSVLSLSNVSFSDYNGILDANFGLWDSVDGSTLIEDCIFNNSNAYFKRNDVGNPNPKSVTLRNIDAIDSRFFGEPMAFVVESCVFNGSGLGMADSAQGGVVRDCVFTGFWSYLEIDGSQYVTISGVSMDSPKNGFVIAGGSEVTATDCRITGAGSIAVEVNASMLSMERCTLESTSGTGVSVWGVASRLEMTNCSINATTTRTGYDVSATQSAEAFLLNTTFNKTSISSASGGRIEVLWFATFELRLPWGGALSSPSVFSLTDAMGYEVVNTSDSRGVFQLYEFVHENDVRTDLTPHDVTVEHPVLGVNYTGKATFDHSQHLIIDLVDVARPIAGAGPDQRVPEDSVVSLDGRSSADNDPGLLVHGSFVWSFDEYGTPIVLAGARVDYVFSVPGDFIITLTVTDPTGNAGLDTLVVQVVDVTPPVVRFGGNATVDEDVPSIFDASATTDNDPSFDTSRGRFEWQFDLVDGPLALEGPTVSVTFERPGNYTATLTAHDMADNRVTAQFWVRVLDRTPPSIGGVHDLVVFKAKSGLLDASSSYDNVGIVSFEWTVTYGNESVDLEGAAPAYTFSRLGEHRATLTLRDAAGNENRTTATIVYDDEPVVVVPSNAIGMRGEPLTVPVRVQDSFHTRLTFRIASGPVDASVVGDPSNATFTWTPLPGYENTSVTFDIEVHDGYVGSLGRLTVWVNFAHGTGNRAPVITSTPPLGARRSTPYIYTVRASDPDGDRLGYILETGPAGMTVSTEGTISWDPPYDVGDLLLPVRLAVTDGREVTRQDWQVRFREPKNEPPQILFSFSGLEVRVREEFTVDLSVYVLDPTAKQVDPDDINRNLRWDVSFNSSLVTLVSHDGLEFRFKALDTPVDLELTFTVTDPSGASDSRGMRLAIRPMPKTPVEETPWFWIALALIVIGASLTMGGMAMASRRSRHLAAREAEEEAGEVAEEEGGGEGWDEGPEFEGPGEGLKLAEPPSGGLGVPSAPPQAAPTSAETGEEGLEEGLEEDLDDLLAEVGAFEEIKVAGPAPSAAPTAGAAAPASASARPPPATRAPLPAEPEAPPAAAPRPFVVDGVAVIGRDGRLMASTGRLDDALAPVQGALSGLLASGASSSDTTFEVEGRRVIAAVLGGLGIVCVIRGKEDARLRPQLMEALARLPTDSRKEAAVAVVEELVSSAAARADVVRGAWTAHIKVAAGFKGSSVVLGVLLRNDTDATMHNVRIELGYDHDALRIGAVRPKLLVSQDRVSVGNLAPGRSLELEVSFETELCLSSQVAVTANYTDPEGHHVVVPARPAQVDVRPPRLRPAGALPDKGLVDMATGGLAHSGRRAFSHTLDGPRSEIHDLAVRKAKEAGLALVRELDEPELMRKETWLLGEGAGGPPSRVLARISSHGTDHVLEVFVASDDAASVVGLLGHLSMELPDSVRSGMPGADFDRLRDPRLLSDLEIWPTLLEYAVEGD